MKRKLLSLLLVVVMLISTVVLSSCNGETEIVDVAAEIYSLYMICEDGTTTEAIHEVETQLNRLVFYELGYCVKLFMVTQDEYDDLIAEALAETKAYTEEKNKKGSKKSASSTASSEEESKGEEFRNIKTGETTYFTDVLTGDNYIDMLDAGYEYVMPNPRVDIFTVVGYDEYIKLVGESELAALDEKLTSEAKLIKDYIYPTFLSAAKVTNAKGTRKTYGIPMNKGIGEYSYIVFDKEYLDKYQIDADTMKNLEDLESYLEIIKANEPDVVPLANVFDCPDFAYLFEDGFTSYISDGTYCVDTYTDSAVLEYMTLVSRYNIMGYLKDASDDERWAVKFVKGTYEDIEKISAETGREYSYTIHSYPVATNEDLLSALFCISAYTVSDELTAVSRILEYMLTNSSVANLLAYGVEGIHYSLNNNDQIVINKNSEYHVNLNLAGNSFITTTLAGENTEKWNLLKQQNIDSSNTADQSASLGFAYYPVSIENPDDKTIVYTEPNYVEILEELCDEFYPDLIAGKTLNMTFEEIKNEIIPIITESLAADVIEKYTNILNTAVLDECTAARAVGTAYWTALISKAETAAINKYSKTSNQRTVQLVIKQEIADANPGASESEINTLFNQIATTEYVKERLLKYYEKEIEEEKYNQAYSSQSKQITKDYDAYLLSDAYKKRLSEILDSNECQNEINEIVGNDVFESNYDRCLELMTEYIRTKLQSKIDDFYKKANETLLEAYIEFQNEYLANFPVDDEEKRSEADFRSAIISVTSGITKFNTQLKAELHTIVQEELGPDELAQNVSDTTDARYTEKFIQDVVIETFNYNADKTSPLSVANENMVSIVNNFITLDDVKAKYEDQLKITFEKKINLLHTVYAETSSSSEEESTKVNEYDNIDFSHDFLKDGGELYVETKTPFTSDKFVFIAFTASVIASHKCTNCTNVILEPTEDADIYKVVNITETGKTYNASAVRLDTSLKQFAIIFSNIDAVSNLKVGYTLKIDGLTADESGNYNVTEMEVQLVDVYSKIFEKRIQDQYYDFNPLPVA